MSKVKAVDVLDGNTITVIRVDLSQIPRNLESTCIADARKCFDEMVAELGPSLRSRPRADVIEFFVDLCADLKGQADAAKAKLSFILQELYEVENQSEVAGEGWEKMPSNPYLS